jgi:hypothetical protein
MSRLQQPRLAKAERVLPAGSMRGSALPLPSEPNIFELFERHLIPRDRSAQGTSDSSPRLARPGERLDRFSGAAHNSIDPAGESPALGVLRLPR